VVGAVVVEAAVVGAVVVGAAVVGVDVLVAGAAVDETPVVGADVVEASVVVATVVGVAVVVPWQSPYWTDAGPLTESHCISAESKRLQTWAAESYWKYSAPRTGPRTRSSSWQACGSVIPVFSITKLPVWLQVSLMKDSQEGLLACICSRQASMEGSAGPASCWQLSR
jgi:hypothetical protein